MYNVERLNNDLARLGKLKRAEMRKCKLGKWDKSTDGWKFNRDVDSELYYYLIDYYYENEDRLMWALLETEDGRVIEVGVTRIKLITQEKL